MAWLLAATGLGLLAVPFVHATAYARHARLKRRLAATIPFDDDTYAVPSWPEHVRLVSGETVATLWLAAAPLCTERPKEQTGDHAVLLLAPPALPASAMRVLAHAIRQPGRLVEIARVPARRSPRAMCRLVDRITRIRQRAGAVPVSLVVFGRAVRGLGTLLAIVPDGAVERILLLGATECLDLDSAELPIASIYSLDDAWVSPPDGARQPHGYNVALHGWGHLSLLVAERVHTLVRETLARDDDGRARASVGSG